MTNPQTISEGYLAQQQELHKNPQYGIASKFYAPVVKQVLEGTKAKSISDYGAGKQVLKSSLNALGVHNFSYYAYDPAFPEYGQPKTADLVCCIDVLEHIEEEYLANVLAELATITTKYGFFSVHTGAAEKHLPDGRNAHLIQQPSSWWLPKLCEHFEVVQLSPGFGGFWVIVEPRKNLVKT